MTWLRVARRARRRAMAHRRVVAACLAGVAVAAGLRAAAPAGVPTATVVVAARDLDLGMPLRPDDVALRAIPRNLVPDGALPPGEPLAGRLVAGPVRRGETLTDARLVAPSLLARTRLGRDAVASPVRLADAGAAALLRPGDRVDVYAVPATAFALGGDAWNGKAGAGDAAADATHETPPDAAATAARLVATDLLVLTVPAPDAERLDPDGALVVFATTRPVARLLAHAAATGALSVTLRPPP